MHLLCFSVLNFIVRLLRTMNECTEMTDHYSLNAQDRFQSLKNHRHNASKRRIAFRSSPKFWVTQNTNQKSKLLFYKSSYTFVPQVNMAAFHLPNAEKSAVLLMFMFLHWAMPLQMRHLDQNDNNDIGGETRGAGAFSCYTCNVRAGQDDRERCIDKVEECPAASALLPSAPFNSCSTLLHLDFGASSRTPTELQPTAVTDGQRARVRKFCTSPGSAAELLAPLLTLLAENGGAGGVCQPLDSWAHLSADPLLPSIAEGSTRARLLSPRRINARRGKRGTTVRPPAAGDEPSGRVGAIGPPAPPTSHSATLLCVCTKSLCNEGDFQDVLSRSIYVAGMDGKAKFVAETAGGGRVEEDKNNNQQFL